MGFIQALGQTVVRPGSSIKSLSSKLARKFVKHWWKHTKQRDLDDVKIYNSVRVAIAANVKFRMDSVLEGIALRRTNAPFYVMNTGLDMIWA